MSARRIAAVPDAWAETRRCSQGLRPAGSRCGSPLSAGSRPPASGSGIPAGTSRSRLEWSAASRLLCTVQGLRPVPLRSPGHRTFRRSACCLVVGFRDLPDRLQVSGDSARGHPQGGLHDAIGEHGLGVGARGEYRVEVHRFTGTRVVEADRASPGEPAVANERDRHRGHLLRHATRSRSPSEIVTADGRSSDSLMRQGVEHHVDPQRIARSMRSAKNMRFVGRAARGRAWQNQRLVRMRYQTEQLAQDAAAAVLSFAENFVVIRSPPRQRGRKHAKAVPRWGHDLFGDLHRRLVEGQRQRSRGGWPLMLPVQVPVPVALGGTVMVPVPLTCKEPTKLGKKNDGEQVSCVRRKVPLLKTPSRPPIETLPT